MSSVASIIHVSFVWFVIFSVVLNTRFAKEIRTFRAIPCFCWNSWLESWVAWLASIIFLSSTAQPRLYIVSTSIKNVLMNFCVYFFMSKTTCFNLSSHSFILDFFLNQPVICSCVSDCKFMSCLSNLRFGSNCILLCIKFDLGFRHTSPHLFKFICVFYLLM